MLVLYCNFTRSSCFSQWSWRRQRHGISAGTVSCVPWSCHCRKAPIVSKYYGGGGASAGGDEDEKEAHDELWGSHEALRWVLWWVNLNSRSVVHCLTPCYMRYILVQQFWQTRAAIHWIQTPGNAHKRCLRLAATKKERPRDTATGRGMENAYIFGRFR